MVQKIKMEFVRKHHQLPFSSKVLIFMSPLQQQSSIVQREEILIKGTHTPRRIRHRRINEKVSDTPLAVYQYCANCLGESECSISIMRIKCLSSLINVIFSRSLSNFRDVWFLSVDYVQSLQHYTAATLHAKHYRAISKDFLTKTDDSARLNYVSCSNFALCFQSHASLTFT